MKKGDMYEYWLARIKGISAVKKCRAAESVGSAEGIYYIEETQLKKMMFLTEEERNTIRKAKENKSLREEYEKMEEKDVWFVTAVSEDFPERLKNICGCPYALYVRGNLPDENSKKAAIIGARKCTAYGEKYAVEFGKALAEAGVDIVSGMARGIDGMGHRGALLGGGKTYAVLGSGPDVCYPKEHIGLYTDIIRNGGGILSEYPPGTPPVASNFPARNRIISGISDAVLVMEARRKSGSLITVDFALEQGKDVYALPGPVNSALSAGCNRLIAQGAGILLSPDVLAEDWGLEIFRNIRENEKNDKNEKMLESDEELLYSCLGLYPKNVDQLVRDTKLSIKSVMEALVTLQLQGRIREVSRNCYISVDEHLDRKK